MVNNLLKLLHFNFIVVVPRKMLKVIFNYSKLILKILKFTLILLMKTVFQKKYKIIISCTQFKLQIAHNIE